MIWTVFKEHLIIDEEKSEKSIDNDENINKKPKFYAMKYSLKEFINN